LVRREDVHIPTRQAGREADILAPLADRQRELIVVDDDRGSTEFEAEGDLNDLGGLQGVLNQDLAGLIPTDAVDLLAVEFIDDVLDARTPHADAGTDGIDLGVDRTDREFGAVAGFAGHRLDLDDTLRNLGHLDLEEFLDE